MALEKINASVLKELFLNSLITKPSKIKQDLKWSCQNWNLNDWATNFGTYKFKFRVYKIGLPKPTPQWEGDAIHFLATLEQFLNWKNGSVGDENPFAPYNKCEFWAYSSYNYLNEVFSQIGQPDPINWCELGFPEKTGNESVLWVGTKGANTPCHMDTYGCNIVVQMTGRKLWILFPPDNTSKLYPTRIPYEESSVYSLVNLVNPNVKKFPKFFSSTPYCTILEPGEILFVPHHWWHYVHNLETSVSINTWIELSQDSECRLQEAVVKLLADSLFCKYQPSEEDWINPFEDLSSSNEMLDYINHHLQRVDHLDTVENLKKDLEIPSIIHPLKSCTVTDMQLFLNRNLDVTGSEVEETDEVQNVGRAQDIINSILQPDVISLIVDKLKQTYQ